MDGLVCKLKEPCVRRNYRPKNRSKSLSKQTTIEVAIGLILYARNTEYVCNYAYWQVNCIATDLGTY